FSNVSPLLRSIAATMRAPSFAQMARYSSVAACKTSAEGVKLIGTGAGVATCAIARAVTRTTIDAATTRRGVIAATEAGRSSVHCSSSWLLWFEELDVEVGDLVLQERAHVLHGLVVDRRTQMTHEEVDQSARLEFAQLLVEFVPDKMLDHL